MRDGDIRRELDALLRRQHAEVPGTFIRHEMGLCGGKRRIDIALLNGELAGFEIKSDEDTLLRLSGQASVYNQVLDRVTLVTTPHHQEKAIKLLPTWWGVMVAKQHKGRIVFEEVRQPAVNTDLDPFALSQMLWRGEALEELRAKGLSKGLSNKARHYVWLALSKASPTGELRDMVRERIKDRLGSTGDPPHGQSGVKPPIATNRWPVQAHRSPEPVGQSHYPLPNNLGLASEVS